MQKQYSISDINNLSAQDLLSKSHITSGFLRKKEGKPFTKWNHKFVVLTKNYVFIYDTETSKSPKALFSLLGYTAVCRYSSKSKDLPWAFVLVPAYTNIRLQKFSCPCDRERAQWMRALKSALFIANRIGSEITLPTIDDDTDISNDLYELLEEPVLNSEEEKDDTRSKNVCEPGSRPLAFIKHRGSDVSTSSSCSLDVRNSDASQSSEASNMRLSDASQSSAGSGLRNSNLSSISDASEDQRSSGTSHTTSGSNEEVYEQIDPPVYLEAEPIVAQSCVPLIPDTNDLYLGPDELDSTDPEPVPADPDYTDIEPQYQNLPMTPQHTEEESDTNYITPIEVKLRLKSLEESCVVSEDADAYDEKLKNSPIGTYLVRKSRTTDKYVLAYNFGKIVKNFRISEDTKGQLTLAKGTISFECMEDLLKAYTSELPLPLFSNGDEGHFLRRGIHDLT